MDYLEKLFHWFGNFWESLTNFVQDVFYWVVNSLIEIFGLIFQWVLGLFPSYVPPLPQFDDSGFSILSAIAWVFPVQFCMQLVLTLGMALTLYFTVGTVLRWLRVVR